jgi:hypothetical protein
MSDLTDPAQRRAFARLSILDEATHISRDSLRDHVHNQHPHLDEDAVTEIVNDLERLVRSAAVAITWPGDETVEGVPARDHLKGCHVRLKLNSWARQGPTEGVLMGQGERGLSIRAKGGGRYTYAHHEVAEVAPA